MRRYLIIAAALAFASCTPTVPGKPSPPTPTPAPPVRDGLPVMRGLSPALNPIMRATAPPAMARRSRAPRPAAAEPCTARSKRNCVVRKFGVVRRPRCGRGFVLRGLPTLWECAHIVKKGAF